MGKYFGTDGIRGIANQDLTPELAYRVGRTGGYVLTKHAKHAKVVVGRDPRISGEMLESALVAGLLSIGAEVVRLGVITTPGVAYMTKALDATAGVMISASHNPVEDNGIKFFGGDGFKLLDEMEGEIEALLDEPEDHLPRPIGGDIGRITDYFEGAQKYLSYLKSTVSTDLSGLKVVVDCANGASSQLAARLLVDLGVEVHAMACNPNGVNINVQCGSTHPEKLQQEVTLQQAHMGLAFDGDADRLIAVDEKGKVVDGDHILYICGTAMNAQGKLNHRTIVTTVMANFGLKEALSQEGIRMVETAVGDRYVMEEMRKGGYTLGGEQSGHVIFLNYSTTGDGLLTALQLMQAVKESAMPLSQLASKVVKYPQVLVNVRVADKNAWRENPKVQEALTKGEEELGGRGRILVRPSGTEPIVRVMVEGPEEGVIRNLAERIGKVIEEESGKA
ncbi:phosphoglucosamine mutase [Thermicanus aegyptius]|uniref:phosphoglucosamine mutase n=1 Tax=Thermicanus aegyptius TaxID=94009 RepID=UPI0004190073|nr:phosphoglucosamine mutase [Thermicanus aegyptius]